MGELRRPRDPRLVVAAVVRDASGRLLVQRRRQGTHLEGLWEFPGGAVEPGEEPAAALERELEEELGVAASAGDPITFAWHRDDHRDVLLLFFQARIESGAPHGREGQEIRWVTSGELGDLPTPPADAELVRMLVSDGGSREG